MAGQTHSLDKPSRFSFLFFAGILVLTACLRLGGPLVVILFSFFALTKLNFLPGRGRWVAVGLFLFLWATLAYGLGLFINAALVIGCISLGRNVRILSSLVQARLSTT